MYVQQQIIKTKEITSCTKGILNTLLYYDLFSYPLTEQEIYNFHPMPFLNKIELTMEISGLVQQGLVYEHEGFYTLNKKAAIVERRKKGNQLAEKYLKRARLLSRFISQVPFVRQISLSGSISKGYMEKKSDIDYFIVAAPGRVWLARTFLALFKKIFLLNSRKYLCINYFIDEKHLEICEKNIFTAIEIATLVPTYNSKKFAEFNWENNWTYGYLPNNETNVKHVWEKEGVLKKFTERVFTGKVGDVLDNFCMELTMRYWRNKHRHTPFINGSIRCSKWEAKYHPQHFQKKILDSYNRRIRQFEMEHNLSLS